MCIFSEQTQRVCKITIHVKDKNGRAGEVTEEAFGRGLRRSEPVGKVRHRICISYPSGLP